VNIIAGTHDNIVRALMPLTIDWETLERGLDIMEESLAQVVGD
jgi:4-aminobutyrate aminotransferase-like enzyme